MVSRTSFSDVAAQNFDNVFTSSYKTYLVILEEIYATTGTDDLHLQFRYSTTTEAAGYYGSSIRAVYDSATITNIQNNNATQFTISQEIGSSSNWGIGFFYVYNVGNSNQDCAFTGQFAESQSAVSTVFSGKGANQQLYTGFRLKSSSTNIFGTVAIYGLAAA